MNPLVTLAAELQAFCNSQGWKFCVIGGLAVQHWGEPRVTNDVDLTLLTGFGKEEAYIAAWLAAYPGRMKDPAAFALANRVLLLRSKEGIGIDVALGALPFEVSAVTRAREIEMSPGIFLSLCSPEDLVVMKAFAARVMDWHDIRGILVRQGTRNLDWAYIWKELKPLCELKEAPDIPVRLEKLRLEIAADEPL